MPDESDEPTKAHWLGTQLRAFARWSVFWLISLFLAAAFFRIGPFLFPGVDFTAAQPYVDFFVVIGATVLILVILLLFVVDRLR